MDMQPASPPARRRRKSLTQHKRYEDQGDLFVIFLLAGERYGAGIHCVQEILKPRNITEIPHTPDSLAGVINLRGRIVPVVDLRLKFGMPPRPHTKTTRIMVAVIGDLTLGMIVEEVLAVRPISNKRIESASPMLSGSVDVNAVIGLAKLDGEVATLLNLEEILGRRDDNAPAANG